MLLEIQELLDELTTGKQVYAMSKITCQDAEQQCLVC
jgi:hypothetical protein